MGRSASQRTCSNCGTLNNSGDDYCANCGFALDSVMSATIISSSSVPVSTPATLPARRITGALSAGELLGVRYRILQLVGKGGFGAVYQADDERFQGRRRVAVKEMSDAQLGPAERARAIANFRQEADILVQLKHANLPDVSDFLEEGGKAYLIMEFIDGSTLEHVQDAAAAPLDEALVMGWALQLCDVLDYLHNQPQPIIFRDLKPPNMMLTRSNQIKLIDFGIARVFKSSSTKDTDTLGSQGYAPLEQYGRGQSDARTDIYALGATLCDLLTNTVPLAAPMRRIHPQGLISPRQLNPRLSAGTEQVVLKAMGELPDQRYQSAAEMFQAIAQLGFSITRTTGGAPTLSGPTMPPTQPGSSFPLTQTSAPSTIPARQSAPGAASAQPGVQASRVSRRALLVSGGMVAALAAATGISLLAHNAPTQPAGGTIAVTFAYSTEKTDWLKAMVSSFNQGGHTLNSKAIQVQLADLGSVDGQAQILSGQIKPVAWSPASELEINRLNYKWQQTHGGKAIINYTEQLQPRSLVKSPLVLAAWQQRAQTLLSHFNVATLDWATLASAFSASDWSQVGGQAGWGPVKFGQTLPVQSNSGLLTITLLAYNYFHEARGLTAAQVNDPQYWDYLKTFENAVNSFGHSSGTYLKNDVINTGGPAQADVIATYENLVLTLQTQARNQQQQPLLLYYPSVNILSDHPFVVLQGDWVSAEEQQAALQFRDFLLDLPQQRQALAYGFRPANSAVTLTDTSVSSNPFVALADLFPNRQPNALPSQAQAPAGDIVDALINGWSQHYPNPATTDG